MTDVLLVHQHCRCLDLQLTSQLFLADCICRHTVQLYMYCSSHLSHLAVSVRQIGLDLGGEDLIIGKSHLMNQFVIVASVKPSILCSQL